MLRIESRGTKLHQKSKLRRIVSSTNR